MTEHGALLVCYVLLVMNVVWIFVVIHCMDEIKKLKQRSDYFQLSLNRVQDTLYGFFPHTAEEER